MQPPVLHTERLILRGLSLADGEAFRLFFASDHSAFYGGPVEAEESWRKLSMYAGHWPLRGYGPLAITLGDGATIGMVGPWFPEGWPEPEITYFVLQEHGGKGYAAEAVRAVLDWLFTTAGWTQAMSAIAPGNIPSIRMAERLGARKEGSAVIPPNRPMDIYRYPAPEAA